MNMKNFFCLLCALLVCSCSHPDSTGISGSGTIEADEVVVSAETAGVVLQLLVNQGEPVQQGQKIAMLDSEKVFLQKQALLAGLEELDLNIDNARRMVEIARVNRDNLQKKFNRAAALLGENSTTQQQFDDVESAFKAAEATFENAETTLKTTGSKRKQLVAQLEIVKAQLKDAVITAPVTGTVLETFVDRGELARPGVPFVSLADLKNVWIKIYVTEFQLGRIKLGATALLKISAYPDKDFKGTVSWISPSAEFTPKNVQTKEARADLVYAVKCKFENPQQVLKIGQPADIVVENEL
jgi:HlyD family secretion protein